MGDSDSLEDEVVKNENALDTAVALRKQQLAEFHDDEKAGRQWPELPQLEQPGWCCC